MTALYDEEVLAKMDEKEKKSKPSLYDSVNFTANCSRSCTRIIKTHLSYEMLPHKLTKKNPKINYVTRNPRDTVVSFYNHWKIFDGFTGMKS